MEALTPVIRSVLYLTDHSDEDESAFAHSLASAVVAGATFTIMGIARGSEAAAFDDFPKVRETLVRWRLLPEGAPRTAVADELGIQVKKLSIGTVRPLKAVTDYVAEHEEDLVVIAWDAEDTDGWLRGATAERLAEHTQAMTLFVPSGGRGFVSAEDGSLSLRRVLVPIATTPDPAPAVARAARVAEGIGEPDGEITLLHVGDPKGAPAIKPPSDHPWSWNTECVQGDVIDEIVAAADRLQADLVVMATDGQDGLLDIFRGSHSQRVLRRTTCPLLAIPV